MEHDQSPALSEDDRFRCMKCGYNVRGVESDFCPECGDHLFIRIAKCEDGGRFHAIAAALSDAGIEHRTVQINPPSHALNQWIGGRTFFGTATIHVNKHDYERAKVLVRSIEDEPLRPIVDRAEPICPSCGAELDPSRDECCTECGALFRWVEIEEPELDPTGRRCSDCGYDLTANTTKRCPECNSPILADLDALVAAATAGEQDDRKEPSPNALSVAHTVGDAIAVGWEILMIVVVGLCGLAWIGDSDIPIPILAGAIAICLLGGYVGWRWLAARRRSN